MIVVFASRTNNIRTFVNKVGIEKAVPLTPDLKMTEKFWLITYTDKFGDIPEEVDAFLKDNHQLMKGVVGSGNRNFGDNFCKAAHLISDCYKIPLLMTFELSGMDEDVIWFKNAYHSSAKYE